MRMAAEAVRLIPLKLYEKVKDEDACVVSAAGAQLHPARHHCSRAQWRTLTSWVGSNVFAGAMCGAESFTLADLDTAWHCFVRTIRQAGSLQNTHGAGVMRFVEGQQVCSRATPLSPQAAAAPRQKRDDARVRRLQLRQPNKLPVVNMFSSTAAAPTRACHKQPHLTVAS